MLCSAFVALSLTPMLIQTDRAVSVGLIVNELVSNALKHGFPGQQTGQVEVNIREHEDNWVELSISDDGEGIPRDLDIARTDSLGLQLVNLLAQQLHGQLDIRRAKPTRFSLRFQLGTAS